MVESNGEPVFRDALFRQKRKHGKYRVVEPPALEALVADTHAHLQLLPDPALALARCAVHGVRFVCTIVDAFEDGATTFERLDAWREEAAALASTLEGAPEARGGRRLRDCRVRGAACPHRDGLPSPQCEALRRCA